MDVLKINVSQGVQLINWGHHNGFILLFSAFFIV